MKKSFLVIVALVIYFIVVQNSFAVRINVPENNGIDGWQKKNAARAFEANDLYGHIDGGAEIFLEYGFEQLYVQNYTDGNTDIGLEIYEMKSVEAALGIYLMKCGKENPDSSVLGRNTSSPYQMTLAKNNYFIQINNFSGKKQNLSSVSGFANFLLSEIEDKTTDILKQLLGRWQLKNSEGIFLGPLALQHIYTFGEDDIFLQKGKIFGVYADYDVNNEEFTRLLINYNDSKYAESAFDHLIKNLDPYLNIIDSKENKLVFKDYNDQYGVVRLKDELIDIRIFLDENPVE